MDGTTDDYRVSGETKIRRSLVGFEEAARDGGVLDAWAAQIGCWVDSLDVVRPMWLVEVDAHAEPHTEAGRRFQGLAARAIEIEERLVAAWEAIKITDVPSEGLRRAALEMFEITKRVDASLPVIALESKRWADLRARWLVPADIVLQRSLPLHHELVWKETARVTERALDEWRTNPSFGSRSQFDAAHAVESSGQDAYARAIRILRRRWRRRTGGAR